MRKLVGMAVVGAALGALPAVAQPAGEAPGGGRHQHRARAIVEYLDLTQEQQDSWKALREQHRDEMKALREEGRSLRHRLQKALEADEPDAAVGEAAKAAHAHRKAMRQAREAFEGQLKSVLTPEQREKFEAFEAARAMGRKGPGARGHRRGRPGGGTPPVEG
ncbi:MAG: periplasmic heavy metal sensor [Acidobacteria bacterium]|jgi:Spy/CpxP family protein refolding chaperone|nr:periplasmic heavy metal sensor [Acidobacteriota bacterium]